MLTDEQPEMRESMTVSCAILKFPFWICILCAHENIFFFFRFPSKMRLPIFGIAGIFSLNSHTTHILFCSFNIFFFFYFTMFFSFPYSSHHLHSYIHTHRRTHAVFSFLRLSNALSLCFLCACVLVRVVLCARPFTSFHTQIYIYIYTRCFFLFLLFNCLKNCRKT